MNIDPNAASILQKEIDRVLLTPEEQRKTEILLKHRVTPQTRLPPMEPLFRLYDVPCFYRGELVGCCGKAKSGKTLYLSMIMAGALGHKVMALERAAEAPLRVLWLDTEQSQQSTQDIIVSRLMPLAGTETLGDDQFFAFNLRGLGFDMRRQLTELAISTIKPDLVIIDGIKDLMTDINDAVQATQIMERLMALAQQANCCIVCVLHQNKSEADHNMRGSIGTELTNKAFEAYTCEHDASHNLFTVTQTFSRRQPVRRKLYYQLDSQGMPAEKVGYCEQPRNDEGRWTKTTEPLPKLKDLFVMAMEGRTQRPYNEVMAVALKKCGVKDAQAYYALFREAEEQGIIRKMEHPETQANWVEFIENELPF